MTDAKTLPLIHLLRPLGRRLRLRDAQRLAARSLWLPILATTIILLAGRLRPLPGYDRLAWAPLALWVLIVPGFSLLRPLPPMRVARRTDADLALQDRLATALELSGQRGAHFAAELTARQQDDALAVILSIDPAQSFPLRWPRRPLTLAAALMIAAAALILLPNPMNAVLAERAAVAATVEEQAEGLEETADEITQEQSPAPAGQEDIARQLRQTAEQLRADPGDREHALATVGDLEASLRAQIAPHNAARKAALEGLAADLAAAAGAADSGPSLDEAAQQLEELAAQAAQMTPAEQDALASVLEDAARRLAGSDAQLAGALGQLGQGLRSDASPPAADPDADRRSSHPPSDGLQDDAQAAADALRAAATHTAHQQALAQALNRTRQASQALTQEGQSSAARPPEPGQRQGSEVQGQQGQAQQGLGEGQQQGQQQGQQGEPGGGQGEGQQQGQGQQPGQGSGQGEGQQQGQQPGGSGGGQGRGPAGGQADESSHPQGSRPGTSGSVDPDELVGAGELDTVFAPWQQGQPGDPDFVPGRQTGQGQEMVSRNAQVQPGAESAALVPYSEVLASYTAAAAGAMAREYVPARLKEYVRDYFTLLEP